MEPRELTELIRVLTEQWGEITPASGLRWDECLTTEGELRLFWFNTSDGSTHIHMIERDER